MSKDLLLIPRESGVVNFDILGAAEDDGLLLLQRLYVLLFSSPADEYRSGGGGLLLWLEGSNIPSVESFNSMLAISTGTALQALDAEDRKQISSFSALYDGEDIQCELVLADGTTITGTLNNG